jgi:hypothetical protein
MHRHATKDANRRAARAEVALREETEAKDVAVQDLQQELATVSARLLSKVLLLGV